MMSLLLKENPTDTELFGYSVYDLRLEESFDDETFRESLISLNKPNLITAYLPVDQIASIEKLGHLGFQFVECRLHVTKEPKGYFNSLDLFPYTFNRVNDTDELEALINLCDSMEFDDRYSCDHRISRDLALGRNKFFLRQSFERDSEPIYILKNSYSGEVLGFRSFRLDSDIEVSMLLCGVVPGYLADKHLQMINTFELEVIGELGVQYIKAVISARNYLEINRYLTQNGFLIDYAEYVCRRITESGRDASDN